MKMRICHKVKRQKLAFIVIAILAATPFLIDKYIELNTPSPYDLGAYVYSAKHILGGAEIGVEEQPTAELGTLLVNMLGVWLGGYTDTAPKVIQAILQAAALLFMFMAMYRLFGMLPAAVGVIVASVYLSSPLIAFDSFKEQCTTDFMVMGVSCFILYQLKRRRWYAILAGTFLSWAPLFKQIGLSAIGATVIFILLQPLLRNKTWKKTMADTTFLFLGALMALGPLYIWIIGWHIQISLPYKFLWDNLARIFVFDKSGVEAKASFDYISYSREMMPFSKLWPVILRYYCVLIMPIVLAITAIVLRILKVVQRACYPETIEAKSYDRFVFLFSVWWILDMAFVWLSPHCYSHYYLPLCASSAILAGYVTALYVDGLQASRNKGKWVVTGFIGILLMAWMTFPIIFGVKTDLSTGKTYTRRSLGYVQRFNEIFDKRKLNHKEYWQLVGEYIREHSDLEDKIYVWGWYPGIYVVAQRFSPVPQACEANMNIWPSNYLSEVTIRILNSFERQQPRFIVDTRKIHFPGDRPPLELWPRVKRGFLGAEKAYFLPLDKDIILKYDKAWSEWLKENFDEEEALRYEAMRPFREYVMENYKIVKMFGPHVLFEPR